VTRSGQKSFEVGAFNSVLVDGSSSVVVSVGGPPSVQAEGDSQMVDRLDVRADEGALRIGSHRLGPDDFHSGGGPVTVHVTVPALTCAVTVSSGSLKVDKVEGEAFELAIVGSGSIEIGDLRVRRAGFSLSGSGSARVAGAVDTANVVTSGSGRAELDRLSARRIAVSATGSGRVTLRASEAVEGASAGSGGMVIHGGASCAVVRMGSGDIRCVG
jgi:hypothetical protein